MSKKLLLLFTLFSIISCIEGIRYDAEKRLVFQTVVLNSSGQPLPNSHVEITAGSFYSNGLISKGKTDQNGKITLVFPAPEGDLTGINLKIYNDDAQYLDKGIFNIHNADFENSKLIYQNGYLLKLEETAPLELTYNQTSSNTVVINIGINGIYTMNQEYYHFDDFNFYPENNYMPAEISVKKNQTFQLKYTVLNMQTQAETDHVIDLQIGNDALNYTINY